MVAFSIFGVNIYWYGIFYLIGFAIAYVFLYFLGKSNILSKHLKLQKFLRDDLDDLMISLIIGVLIGGRLGEVLIYEWHYFSQNLCEIIKVWHGGMSFFGGMIGVFLALFILSFVKGLSKKDLLLLFDCLVVIVPVGIILGRFGNYLNQELYGLVVPEGAWGISSGLYDFLVSINIFHVYPKIDELLRINTNFISVLFEGILLLALILFVSWKQLKKKNIMIGLNSSVFLIFYSLFRFLIEYLRVDSQLQVIHGLTISQWLFLCLFFVGVALLFFVLKKRRRK